MKRVYVILLLSILLGCTGKEKESPAIVKEEKPSLIIDENGIVKNLYDDNYYYNPVTIAATALGEWYNLTGYKTDLINLDASGNIIENPTEFKLVTDGDMEKFMKYADWLLNNSTDFMNDAVLWEYHFDYFSYLKKAPWVSGMAQGRAIQVLLRAYILTDNERYLVCADKAVNSYKYTFEEGGFKQYDSEGNVFYEEYPGLPTTHVLNGFIFALWGLYEHYIVTGSEVSLKFYNEGLRTLENRISDYDEGGNSTYDLLRIGQTFKFMMNKCSKSIPVDEVIFTFNDDLEMATELDIGGDDIEGMTGNHNRVDIQKKGVWGKKDILDSRTVRLLNRKYSFSTSNIIIPKNANYPGDYSLIITYKDVFEGEVEVFIYNGKEYKGIGSVKGGKTNSWKSHKLVFSADFLRAREASEGYNLLHARQLSVMYKITGNQEFRRYSELFSSYSK